jgi:hypothetical protein
MNIFNTKFEKKIKKKQNEYTLKINFNLDFSDELSYKIFGKNHLIQCGILKKNNSSTKIKIYFTTLDSLFILVKIDDTKEYFENVNKNDFLKLLNNKNIEINIKKKPSFDNLSTNLLTDYINNLKVNCSESESDDTNNINFYSDDEENESDNESDNEIDNNNENKKNGNIDNEIDNDSNSELNKDNDSDSISISDSDNDSKIDSNINSNINSNIDINITSNINSVNDSNINCSNNSTNDNNINENNNTINIDTNNTINNDNDIENK